MTKSILYQLYNQTNYWQSSNIHCVV